MSRGKYVALGAGIVVVAFFAFVMAAPSPDGIASNEGGPLSFALEEGRQTIVDGVTEIEKGGFVVYTFSAPNGARDVQLQGDFAVSNGDIKVVVVDDDILQQWKEGRSVFFRGDVYYTSETPLSSGSVQVPEGGSKWTGNGEPLYIIFDNTHDTENAKQVDAMFELSYTQYTS